MGGKRFGIGDNHESIGVLISNLDTGIFVIEAISPDLFVLEK